MRIRKREEEQGKNPSLLKLLPPELISELQADSYSGKPLLGKEGILAPMIKELVEL